MKRKKKVCAHLIITWRQEGERALKHGNLRLAERFFNDALSLSKSLVESDPTNAQRQSDLAVSYDSLGHLNVHGEDYSEAEKLFTKSLHIRQRLVDADPASPVRLSDLLRSFWTLRYLAVFQGDLAKAQLLWGESIRVEERLAAADPTYMQRQRERARPSNHLARWGGRDGDLTTGNERLEKRHAQSRRLLLESLGSLHLDREYLPEAQWLFEQALRISQRLAESTPHEAALQRDLAESYEKLANAMVQRGMLVEAQDLVGKSLHIRQKLVESDPSNVDLQCDVAISLGNLDDIAIAMEDLPIHEHLRKVFECRQRRADSVPGNGRLLRHLSELLVRRSDLALDQGDLGEWKRLHREILRIAQRLVDSEPANSEVHDQLAVAHYNLAKCAYDTGDRKGGLEELEKCFGVLSQMKKRGFQLDPMTEQMYQELPNAMEYARNYPKEGNVRKRRSKLKGHGSAHSNSKRPNLIEY